LEGKKNGSTSTRNAIMRAAEKLIAKKGIENVSIREIVEVSGQKNQSALQYHFENMQGLIKAIHESRNEEIHEKRAAILEEILAKNKKPALRDLCKVMILPTFLLAKSNPAFRRFVVAFGHEIALTPNSALSLVEEKEGHGTSALQTGELLRAALPHLNSGAYLQRMDSAVRLCSISMSHHSRQKSAFHGPRADLFLNNLIDELVGLLSAPVSKETLTITKSIRTKS
jgi:AcrR family transcriptional regulator|tara:strand:+ start:237 stop:917 length:681 start_codon:yes stop_codon:yes gene_type:complete